MKFTQYLESLSNVGAISTHFNPDCFLFAQISLNFKPLSFFHQAISFREIWTPSTSPGVSFNFHLAFNSVIFFMILCVFGISVAFIANYFQAQLVKSVIFILYVNPWINIINFIPVQCFRVAFSEWKFIFISELKCVIFLGFSTKYLHLGCYKMLLSHERECWKTFIFKLCFYSRLAPLCKFT